MNSQAGIVMTTNTSSRDRHLLPRNADDSRESTSDPSKHTAMSNAWPAIKMFSEC